ncbi:MAG: hypothetical protein WD512_11535 [Candidatus Paceibacterota bacterium]
MNNTTTQNVHISTITIGDTIEHNGQLKTVTATNIGGDSFIGRTLFGDSYNSGRKQVKKVSFIVPNNLK